MGGVDRNDELLSFYTALRKSTKWYKKIATHFIEEALLNAYILYKKRGGRKSHREFLSGALYAMLLDGRAAQGPGAPPPPPAAAAVAPHWS